MPQVGVVKFNKSTKAKRINITVRPEKGVVVAVPYNCSFEEAERFALAKIDWIKKALDKMKQTEQNRTLFTPEINFYTKFRKLNIFADVRKNIRLNVTASTIDVYYPNNFDIHSDNIQNAIRKAIEHAWKIEAFEYLPGRIEELAKQHGFIYSGLEIKNTRSFWGKCFANNSITLSLHLMHLPDKLIDYVILHELCHTVHKNHGKYFWALLERILNGEARLLDKEMKKYSTKLY